MTLLLATPVRASNLPTALVSLGYADFRVKLARLMPDFKIFNGEIVFSLDVVRARNRIVGFVLDQPDFADVTHVLWVDDDQWPEDIRIVPEMIARCRGVLGAPYTNKKVSSVARTEEEGGGFDHVGLRWVHRLDSGGVGGVGFGFTMTTRMCLEGLAKDAKWYTDLPNTMRVPNLFGQLYETVGGIETLLSEDFSFCKRAREAGYPVELYTQAGVIYHSGGHPWSARDMPGGIVK